MGYEISAREIEKILLENNDKTIILCTSYKKIENELKEFYTVSLGVSLSDRLIRYPSEKRNEILLEEMDNLLLDSPNDKLLIKDIDILFNPEYKFDVLKYFSNIARVKKVVVVWNGIINNGYLQYSENGYSDYKRYLIRNYDIICIK